MRGELFQIDLDLGVGEEPEPLCQPACDGRGAVGASMRVDTELTLIGVLVATVAGGAVWESESLAWTDGFGSQRTINDHDGGISGELSDEGKDLERFVSHVTEHDLGDPKRPDKELERLRVTDVPWTAVEQRRVRDLQDGSVDVSVK